MLRQHIITDAHPVGSLYAAGTVESYPMGPRRVTAHASGPNSSEVNIDLPFNTYQGGPALTLKPKGGPGNDRWRLRFDNVNLTFGDLKQVSMFMAHYAMGVLKARLETESEANR